MVVSGHRRKKQTAKIAKKKVPKHRCKRWIRKQKLIRKATKKYHYIKKHHGSSKAEKQAKAWIAWNESRNQWHVSNGYCYGKYQLSYDYLHGDYSPSNQVRVADHYVHTRYGNWVKAKRFWQAHHWY